MIGLAFEIVTSCPGCSAPLPLNALSLTFTCGTCGQEATFTLDDWNGLLEDALSDGPTTEVGQGEGSTIFARRNYEMMWARFDPYFFDTKDDVDLADLPAALERGFLPHPGGGEPMAVRSLPPEFAELLQGVEYLVGEDPHQLPASSALGDLGVSSATDPVAFTCPHCGGGLQVDGSRRAVDCEYCHASAVLPDQLWQRLHPVTRKKRWFLVFDEGKRPYSWDDDLWDAVVDDEGRTYLALDADGDMTLHVVCLRPDRTLLWRRTDLPYGVERDDGRARLALAGDRLMVWCGARHSAVFLSLDDGAQMDKLGGKGGRQPEGGRFSLKGSRSAAVDGDGSVVAWHPSRTEDAHGFETWELMRFDGTGTQVPVWPGTRLDDGEPAQDPPPKKGFFARLGDLFGGHEDPPEPPRTPRFEDLGDRPGRCTDEDVEISFGADGSLFLVHDRALTRLAPDGRLIYHLPDIEHGIEGRVFGLADGAAVALVRGREDRHTAIKTISPDGARVAVLHDNVTRGGAVGEEDVMARQGDGTIHTFGFGGQWRVIAPDGTLRFASKVSREFEEEQGEDDSDDDEE